jgi:hypothetical protein
MNDKEVCLKGQWKSIGLLNSLKTYKQIYIDYGIIK